MAHDNILKQNGLRISWGDTPLYESPSSPKRSVEDIYDLPDEGKRAESGNPNRSAVTPIYGPKNIAEERVAPRPAMSSPPLPEWQDTAASAVSPPTWERRGIPTVPSVDSEAPASTAVASPGQPYGIKTPEGMGPPATESATAKWFKNMTPDQRTALQRSLLATGLSLMASSKPSPYPVSAVSQFGEAGLTGLAVYDRTLANAGEEKYRQSDLNLRERSFALEAAKIRMAVDEAMRKDAFESPGAPATTRPNYYAPPMGGDDRAGSPRGLRLPGDPAPPPRLAKGLPGLKDTVEVPAKPPGQGYRAREADIRYRNAVTDKLLSEASGEIAKMTIEGKRLDIEKTKAEIDRLRADAARLPKTQRDFIKEKAYDAFLKARAQHLKDNPGDEEGATASGQRAETYIFRREMGEEYLPGTSGENRFDLGTGLRDVPPTPGQWISPPPGAKDTGRTSGGKKVYQLPNGDYWVP